MPLKTKTIYKLRIWPARNQIFQHKITRKQKTHTKRWRVVRKWVKIINEIQCLYAYVLESTKIQTREMSIRKKRNKEDNVRYTAEGTATAFTFSERIKNSSSHQCCEL